MFFTLRKYLILVFYCSLVLFYHQEDRDKVYTNRTTFGSIAEFSHLRVWSGRYSASSASTDSFM